MKFTIVHMFILGIIALLLGGASVAGFMYRVRSKNQKKEGFQDSPVCGNCNAPSPCGCKNPLVRPCNLCGDSRPCACNKSNLSSSVVAPCPRVMEPDFSKYILKSQVPSCSKSLMPEMTNYMLKTECPPVPDLSKYVLKSSIPKPQPIIIDNSSCKKDAGECPPCPRPRCPVVNCPPPTKCAPPAPCPRPVCPPTVVKCKSEEANQPTVRPFLAPLSMGTFGMS